MSTNSFPDPDGKFDDFQSNLITKVSANAVAWGISTGEVTALTDAQAPWTSAWAIAKVPNNRTRAQIKAKDDARKSFEGVLRPFVQSRIQINSLMTDEDRLLCGVKPRDKVRTRILKPESSPQLSRGRDLHNEMVFYFRQASGEDGSSKRAKPKGVIACLVVSQQGGTPPAGPSNCTDRAILTRSPKRMPIEPGTKGQTMYAYACWINTRGEQGPWSDLNTFII